MIAKILHSIAFPVDGTMERDSDVSIYSQYIQVSYQLVIR
jgi:hypothetical protein